MGPRIPLAKRNLNNENEWRKPCNGLAFHLEGGGVVMPLVTLHWVSCDRLASHLEGGGVLMLLVTSHWVSCDGLASHIEGGEK